jgi:hypothetical protein
MSATPKQRRLAAIATAITLVAGTVTFSAASSGGSGEGESEAAGQFPWKAREFQGGVQGEWGTFGESDRSDPHEEAVEAGVAASQFANARRAPGWVAQGAYSAAFAQWQGMPTKSATWSEVTNVKYNADDLRYKDYYSNSGAGSSYVSGRVPAIAVDPQSGAVFAAGAVGGVMKSATGKGGWTSFSDQLPASASGDIEVIDGKVWYATGDAATGSTTYVGNGVYATSPDQPFSYANSKVGGNELDGATILSIAKSGDRIYIAGSYGIWSHAATWTDDAGRQAAWKLEFAPHTEYLPGGTKQFDPQSPYKNIAFDVIGDPDQPGHLLAAMGWVDGEDYNGWYERKSATSGWTRIKPQGSISDLSIGKTTFEYSADGSVLYAVVQTPIIKGSFFYYSELQGVFASRSGSLTGPWSKIADSTKLQNSGSALKPQIPKLGLFFTGYQPGVQAWFNQFLGVDPDDPDHVFLGLEEVYESFNGGATWRTTGPYWNFYFPCWQPGNTLEQNGCNVTTHSDQHDVAFGEVDGEPTAFFSNDGGVYSWPMESGQVDSAGHGRDWSTLSADGTLRQTQYYAMDGGLQANSSKEELYERLAEGNNGLVVSGGLQDNGGSILFEGESTMGSNFGGDGGDVIVDPMDGCNIAQEYVALTIRVTNRCAAPTSPTASVDPSQSVTRHVAPPDPGARFIAPFAADAKNIKSWIAGGAIVWHQAKGFDIASSSEWKPMLDLPAASASSAVAVDGDVAVAGYCGGGCNPGTFTRGIAIGKPGDASTWVHTEDGMAGGPTLDVVGGGTLPNRYIGGVAIDPDTKDLFLAFNGYSRKWVAGPGINTLGAGTGHVFMSTNEGTSWVDISGNLPDVPLNSIKVLGNGAIVAGSDLGVVYAPSAAAAANGGWLRLDSSTPTLPLTVVTDVEVQPNGDLYVSTYGRGIWKVSGAVVGATPVDGGWYQVAASGGAAAAAAAATSTGTAAGSTTGPTSTTTTATTTKVTKKKATKKRARAKARLSRR